MCLAIPGKIICIPDAESTLRNGLIDFSGVTKEVSLAYVPEAGINDYVIVHAGFAIAIIDPQEALASLQAFHELQAYGENP